VLFCVFVEKVFMPLKHKISQNNNKSPVNGYENFYNDMFDRLTSISKQISGLIKYLKEYEKKKK